MKVFLRSLILSLACCLLQCSGGGQGPAEKALDSKPLSNGALKPLSGEGQGSPQDVVQALDSSKPLSVLLIVGLYTGHIVPMVSLGAELVRRGHNVTLCANVLKGSTLYPHLPESVGIRFVSAGYDALTQEQFEEIHMLIQGIGSGSGLDGFRKLLNLLHSSFIQIRAKVEEIGLDRFDITVTDISVLTIAVYFDQLGKKSIVYSTLLGCLPHLTPRWPTPLITSGQEADLSFLERLFNIIVSNVFLEPFMTRTLYGVAETDPHYRKVLQNIDVSSYVGLRIPLLYNTVVGFDFPMPRYPMVEFVGPVLMQSPPRLGRELQEWLDSKENKTVVFISMGTTGFLKADNAQALLDGVMATPYSVVWALKLKNRQNLGAVSFGAFPGRLFLADWVPQLTVLQHNSILMSILHCGLNGVQESISNSLPIICMPLGYDQFEVATKVVSAGVGLSMYSMMGALQGNKDVKAEDIESTIHEIVSGAYARDAGRIRQLYKLAGGARRAADLVEHYEDVGYKHLVPAFAKYEWSWVQYYNIDVWLLLGLVCGVLGWVWWRVGKWCFKAVLCTMCRCC